MPALTVVSIYGGAPGYGCQFLAVTPWQIPGTPTNPSKLAPRPGSPERRFRIRPGPVIFQCVWRGIIPLDTDISATPPAGGMFSASLAEGAVQPFWFPSPLNKSSIIRARFDWIGHYAVAIRMRGGGCEIIPFDIENY